MKNVCRQLRDVVLCPSTKPELYSIFRCNVDKYDIRKHQSTRVLGNLEFDPVSMAISGDYIVVGGQRAELAVGRLSEPDNLTVVRSGGSINNFDSVTNLNITGEHDVPRLLVCNNDHSVRLLALPNLDLLTELRFPTAVNYAAISPDGTKMCVVGDSNEVFLFHKRGDTFEKIATLTASNDASFSCDWSQNSKQFAVGSQDGYATVWDIRSQQKMVQLETFQHGRSRGACRNVKFSPSGSVDLLAFSEHTGYVNIVDTREFARRQVLSAGMHDLQITGMRFAADSSALFVGLEQSILDTRWTKSADTVLQAVR
ncbi:WD40-repeat-containing domain protein [Kickxella alabastrina]|uniref:WD40-repeat-containing domain protein n=1 Tax=Kickxella alabastrina TaxID=61397 RepID=UPI00221F8498|nr:WD40-repeat-containing domain protein [Kickxella alabastrina]KAI7825497.1 WD40-repeat-containing domain protein [Kickxella alabastrina]